MNKYSRWVFILITGLFGYFLASTAYSACPIYSSSQKDATKQYDPLYTLLVNSDNCPVEVVALRRLLIEAGLSLETTMVANRGFHNPGQGSFSLFEMASGEANKKYSLHVAKGDFFFGHFTQINEHNELSLDQTPEKNALMIEALAWDKSKSMYNFYELRGDGKQGQWFYRGDSADIDADNRLLHRQPDPEHPSFGNRLRCSGCHLSGGPIMKELHAPYNDWWMLNRKLNFGGRQADAALRKVMGTLVSANHLSKQVVAGSKKWVAMRKQQSLQEQLRSLFCPVEINLMSDVHANDDQAQSVAIPIEFFIDPSLLKENKHPIVISRIIYENALNEFGSHFPETNDIDADHAWLTPVKATSDQIAIDHLIKTGLIDRKFMLAVLSVEMTNPVFSQSRCKLLRYLPLTNTPDWKTIFVKNLLQSRDEPALQLAKELLDISHTPAYFYDKANHFIRHCRNKLSHDLSISELYALLLQRRTEIVASEISKNPRGQILEPGFRVIFPENRGEAFSNKLSLNHQCEVMRND